MANIMMAGFAAVTTRGEDSGEETALFGIEPASVNLQISGRTMTCMYPFNTQNGDEHIQHAVAALMPKRMLAIIVPAAERRASSSFRRSDPRSRPFRSCPMAYAA